MGIRGGRRRAGNFGRALGGRVAPAGQRIVVRGAPAEREDGSQDEAVKNLGWESLEHRRGTCRNPPLNQSFTFAARFGYLRVSDAED